ncbi:unnamed protein product [Porites lobata]|uniref:ShKT domain-containing protein n=1 Tax=Porites lobata TaxID=104759 RepID=A0ABN8NRY1_9CNID|nr:unnamed protein product [Porites lobata]
MAFSAVSDGAPGRHLSRSYFPLEGYRAEKRALCTSGQYDKIEGCAYFAAQGYCKETSQYRDYVQSNCYASCGNCEMPPTQPPEVDAGDCLGAHNAKRALHGAQPLTWSSTLAQEAKEWADTLIEKEKPEHAHTDDGENLFWGTATKAYTCVNAVESWYNEEPDYPYNNPPTTEEEFYVTPQFGHFTQIVWKGTHQVGAALATKNLGNGYIKTVIVARYSPRGNILGQFPDNVLPEQ